MLHTFVLHARRLHLPRGAPPVHSAAAGSRTACHPSFHTCPSSHTVGSGPNTGRKVRGVPGVPPVGAHKPRRARRAVRPGAPGNCPGARRRACRRRARAAARQHLANEAGGEAAPAARQLVAGQLRARHADGVVVISLCPLLEPRALTQTLSTPIGGRSNNDWRSVTLTHEMGLLSQVSRVFFRTMPRAEPGARMHRRRWPRARAKCPARQSTSRAAQRASCGSPARAGTPIISRLNVKRCGTPRHSRERTRMSVARCAWSSSYP
jgi:hypothetical protein